MWDTGLHTTLVSIGQLGTGLQKKLMDGNRPEAWKL